MAWTKMAAAAIAGNAGADLDGYRDFRGVPVVGAWTWLPQCNLGLAAEADKAEAYRTLRILQVTFWVLFILLLATSVAIFIFTIIVARLQREAQKAAIEKQQLGQYRLEKELGKGAMGVVYKGYHALLRRPTAIKMLNVDRANDALMERFEHEVQITCQLNHPNTVAIYDYGRTPENVFYYAMEYLDGIDLQTLVEKYGPQPEGRVISILRQACHSLYEAHSLGLVHRDIKPANIMINWRGGEPDVVKVLDFGLVKTLEQRSSAESPAQSSLTGTPLYMSPEAFEFPNSVDCRSDVYALGAVAYFLVCGQPVFYADTLRELAHRHIDDVPVPPSVRLGKPVSVELENAVSACLEKSRAKRPQTTRELAARLSKCPTAGSWTTEDAEAWWGRHQRGQAGTTGSGVRGPVLEQTIVSGSSGTPS
jgi:serine/threonine protein kinase